MSTHASICTLRAPIASHIPAKIDAIASAIRMTSVKVCCDVVVIARRPNRKHRTAAGPMTACRGIRVALGFGITSDICTQIDANTLTKRIALIKVRVIEPVIA